MWSACVCLLLLCVRALPVAYAYHVEPIEDVVRSLGYDLETHTIATEDGYLLTYHRLPRGRRDRSSKSTPRRAVLFNNGILLSSASSLTGRGDFAFSLADAGFDVWLGNYRGNMYSKRHKTLDPNKDKEFWDNISLHELGAKDLPASIDYILRVTGLPKLLYVGASMGTTMFWILGASKPEYMDRVEAMVAIAPVARPSNSFMVNHWSRYLALRTTFNSLDDLGFKELFPYSETTSALLYNSCNSSWLRTLCHRVLQGVSYLSGTDWDIERLLEATKYGPAGVSTKVAKHFLQIAKSQRFQQYDYGLLENRQRYLSDLPAEYDLSRVNCSNIYFIHSDADYISTTKDVEWLASQLPNRPKRLFGSVNHLGHFDLALDKNISALWVTPLVKFLKQMPAK